MSRAPRTRWRLILGGHAEDALEAPLDGTAQDIDEALAYLYDRETASRDVRPDPSDPSPNGQPGLTVPEWINRIHELFPASTVERLEQDALERYELLEMVTDPDVLRRVEPNETLLKAILQTKHLMSEAVLAEARRLVQRVVNDLVRRLARPVRASFWGPVDPRHRSRRRIAKNFDPWMTVRRNLKHFDPASGRLFIETPFFNARVRSGLSKWQVILVVDQSASMLDSVIYAAVTASIFWGLPDLRTHLILFDTRVVDLTDACRDPVETLLKVQLGGGTDIASALAYGADLIDAPRRAIVVLISDFAEGGDPARLLEVTHRIVESGATLVGLASLDERGQPAYDREMAAAMKRRGAQIAAMTPTLLAEWVAERMK